MICGERTHGPCHLRWRPAAPAGGATDARTGAPRGPIAAVRSRVGRVCGAWGLVRTNGRSERTNGEQKRGRRERRDAGRAARPRAARWVSSGRAGGRRRRWCGAAKPSRSAIQMQARPLRRASIVGSCGCAAAFTMWLTSTRGGRRASTAASGAGGEPCSAALAAALRPPPPTRPA